LVNQLIEDCIILKNKIRFISEINSGKINFIKPKEKDFLEELYNNAYDRIPPKTQQLKGESQELLELNSTLTIDNLAKDYDYLLNMNFCSLTLESVEHFQTEIDTKQKALEVLQSRSPREIWEEELYHFRELWDSFEKYMNDYENNEISKLKFPSLTLDTDQQNKVKSLALESREKGPELMSDSSSTEELKATPTRKRSVSRTARRTSAVTRTPKLSHLRQKENASLRKSARSLNAYFGIDSSKSSEEKSPIIKTATKKTATKKPTAKKTATRRTATKKTAYSSDSLSSSSSRKQKKKSSTKTKETARKQQKRKRKSTSSSTSEYMPPKTKFFEQRHLSKKHLTFSSSEESD